MNLQTLRESKTGRLIVALCRYVNAHGSCGLDARRAAAVLLELFDGELHVPLPLTEQTTRQQTLAWMLGQVHDCLEAIDPELIAKKAGAK